MTFEKRNVTAHPPLVEVYDRLYRAWGPQGWWPGRTATEMVVGAVLTQNTAWSNVEKALLRLKAARALSLRKLYEAPLAEVEDWVRPAGFYRVKARRVRALAALVMESYQGRLSLLLREEPARLRTFLLGVHGIGPETADSILLYAAGAPYFVVDAYTRRVLSRHGWLHEPASYEAVADLFEVALPREAQLYNEFHALIVRLGKTHCRAKPRCEGCPLNSMLPPGGPVR